MHPQDFYTINTQKGSPLGLVGVKQYLVHDTDQDIIILGQAQISCGTLWISYVLKWGFHMYVSRITRDVFFSTPNFLNKKVLLRVLYRTCSTCQTRYFSLQIDRIHGQYEVSVRFKQAVGTLGPDGTTPRSQEKKLPLHQPMQRWGRYLDVYDRI